MLSSVSLLHTPTCLCLDCRWRETDGMVLTSTDRPVTELKGVEGEHGYRYSAVSTCSLTLKKVTEPQNYVFWKECLEANWSYHLFKAGPVRVGWSGLVQLYFECPEEWRFYSFLWASAPLFDNSVCRKGEKCFLKKLDITSHSLHLTRITCVPTSVSFLLSRHQALPRRNWIHLLYSLPQGSYKQP